MPMCWRPVIHEKEVRVVRQERKAAALIHSVPPENFVIEVNIAFVQTEDARDALQERILAGAIQPEDRHDAPRRKLLADLMQGTAPAEDFGDARQLDFHEPPVRSGQRATRGRSKGYPRSDRAMRSKRWPL